MVVDDYDVATHLFRDVFDLKVLMDLEGQVGRGVILEIPATTLEIVDADHERVVDVLEASRSFDKRVRIAVRVDDLHEAATAVTDAGGGAIPAPVDTRGAIGTSASRPPTVSS